MAKVYFFSDAHLGLGVREEERKKEERIVRFLKSIQNNASHLFIVGDLFDAWFEYKTVIPKGYHRLLTTLEDLVQAGVLVHYVAGNHDYWMNTFFHEEIGIKTHKEPFEDSINGKRILIQHGDGLIENDTGYSILKKILRNPVNIRLYSLLHPDIGIALASAMSRKSRQYNSKREFNETEDIFRYVTKKITEGYDIVIMGHWHKPTYKEIGKGVYINLGDWIRFYTYAEMENDTIKLKEWKE